MKCKNKRKGLNVRFSIKRWLLERKAIKSTKRSIWYCFNTWNMFAFLVVLTAYTTKYHSSAYNAVIQFLLMDLFHICYFLFEVKLSI